MRPIRRATHRAVSTNIITHDYPEEFELKLSAGSGFNSQRLGRLPRVPGRLAGRQRSSTAGTPSRRDFGLSAGGRKEVLGRELRFKTILNREIDYETAEGFVEGREPKKAEIRKFPRPSRIVESADLSLGELSLSDGRFDLTESERSEQGTGYLGFGLDLDEDGNHKLDASAFYTHVEDELVQLKQNGYLPNFDYGTLAALQNAGSEITSDAFDGSATLGSWISRSVRGSANDAPSRGPLWFASFFESESFERERDLLVFQLNGDHQIDAVPGLHFSWAGNQARDHAEGEVDRRALLLRTR